MLHYRIDLRYSIRQQPNGLGLGYHQQGFLAVGEFEQPAPGVDDHRQESRNLDRVPEALFCEDKDCFPVKVISLPSSLVEFGILPRKFPSHIAEVAQLDIVKIEQAFVHALSPRWSARFRCRAWF